jgi:hypothetical protein
MAWVKRGLVFDPSIQAPWIHSHAQVPTAFEMDDYIRVFFAGRNNTGRSFITYVDLDKFEPTKIVYIHDKPILPLGKTGTFDDEGMMPSDLVSVQGRVYFYYSGWNRRLTCPYHNATGLIFSDDKGVSFYRPFDGPVLDRIPVEPYVAVTPSVLVENDCWRMWYVSGVSWEEIEGQYEPVYVIKHAYSSDGINWVRPNNVCITPSNEMEAFSRPSVVKDGAIYKMWFCFRDSFDYRGGQGSYKLGYAESSDGMNWIRKDDKLDMEISPGGWDSEMQCYPYIIDIASKRYMFYNGNGFGHSGFGLAEWLN